VEPLERRPVLVARHQDDLEAGAALLETTVGRGQHRSEGLAFRVPVCCEVEAYDLVLDLCKVHLPRTCISRSDDNNTVHMAKRKWKVTNVKRTVEKNDTSKEEIKNDCKTIREEETADKMSR
jgi:hypothetical protein